jgi:hypothetical protein
MAEEIITGWTWERLVGALEAHADLDEEARAWGAIRRPRKVRTGRQLLRLVLVYALGGLSLRGTAAWAEAAGEASLSDVALLQRLRACGPWLAELVSRLSAAAHPEGAAGVSGEDGRRVVAVDATMVASPGGQHKPYRVLHTAYDVGAQRFVATRMTDRSVAEHLDVGGVAEGEIRLGDRAYGRYRDLSAVTAAGADYVVRLSARFLKLRAEKGEPVDRAALCRRAEAEGTQDVPLFVHGEKKDAPLAARLIVLPLPAQKAEAARKLMRKNARKWGYEATEAALATAGCLMLVTSLPSKDWPTDRVLSLYRRRWQVELAFKRLKSLIGLEQLRATDDGLVSAHIHAVLLTALLIDLHRPSTPEAPDSPPRDLQPSPSGAPSPLRLAA